MTVAVIGGGAWGTALAQVAAAAGNPVTLWARESDVVASINAAHENLRFLPGVPLSPAIRATDSLGHLARAAVTLVVAPAQHVRGVLAETAQISGPLVLCAKGIEERTGALLHEVAAAVHPRAQVTVLSGPTFAHEVARGLPTAVTVAARDRAAAEAVRDALASPRFRPYLTDDVAGAEIGGAVKNVLAIACGVVDGQALGENARAALISRGFAEMTRFGLARGARVETLAGLSGLGDLVLTCSSTQSRNFSLGRALGQGQSAAEIMRNRETVAEGAHTAPVLARVAREAGVVMPIVDAVCALLDGRASAGQVTEALLSRPLTNE